MWIIRSIILVTLAALGGACAEAHDAAARGSALAWTADPGTLVPIIAAAAWYGVGLLRSASERAHRLDWGRSVAFAGGIAVLILALQSPIDTVSDDLFSVHMAQHLFLMLAAPPLLVWSDPAMVFLRALPRQWRKALARAWVASSLGRGMTVLMHPVTVWTLFSGVFVFWHAPGPYEWALENRWIHIGEHVTLFLTALAFWSIVIQVRGRRRLGYAATMMFVVSTAVLSGLPGALMIFAPRPLYPAHAAGVAEWGLTLLQDQEIAGLIMWIPAGSAYVIAAGWLFIAWLREAEERATARAARMATTLAALACVAVLLAACGEAQSEASLPNWNGDVNRGANLISKYGCGGCHLVPGVRNADGNVGPPLTRIGTRIYIAGLLRNSPDNMALWIAHPQHVLPGNAMPEMNVSEQDARDLTAFLYTLK
jgi:cytochrome c oxidase assembly factor CtaG